MNRLYHLNYFILVFIIANLASSQTTVGVLSIDTDKIYEGYTLIYPQNQSNVYLINNCGEIVHMWADESNFRPGNSVYLLENGNLLKTKKDINANVNTFSNGGAGGIVELRDWDNNLLWSTTILDSLNRAHHDIAPMPNGNILVLYWERKGLDEIIQAGRDTSVASMGELWFDAIREYNPIADTIIWEWHAWDHLVQEHDDTKLNFGTVKENFRKIDINYHQNGFGGRPDFMHTNSIDYNSALDQILLSVAFFEEIWVLDHSTSLEETSTSAGGNSGKGGDILYRWGNPQSYQGEVSDQKLFFQHDAHWIYSVDNNYKIGVFNNRIGLDYSVFNILSPSFDFNSGNYVFDGETSLPNDFDETVTHPTPSLFSSPGMSSGQVLDNGNYLLCSAIQGYIIELTKTGELVWEYVLPFKNGVRVQQGTELNFGVNSIFRAKKYSTTFSAFSNKELLPQGTLEISDTNICSSVGLINEEQFQRQELYYNDYFKRIILPNTMPSNTDCSVFSMLGSKLQTITKQTDRQEHKELNFSQEGIYVCKCDNSAQIKFIIR